MAAFLVRVSDQGRAFARPIPDAASALEAAVLFTERWDGFDPAGEASVTVIDSETGAEQCFRVDLGEHTADPC